MERDQNVLSRVGRVIKEFALSRARDYRSRRYGEYVHRWFDAGYLTVSEAHMFINSSLERGLDPYATHEVFERRLHDSIAIGIYDRAYNPKRLLSLISR